MSGNLLWGDALKNASPEEVVQLAVEAPKLLSEGSIGSLGGASRDTGLLLTKKQIIDLRKYEAAGLALPNTLKDVTDYLRFGTGQDGGAGLKPEDFLDTFLNTRTHARRWSPLRERIMLTGRGLKDFAGSMLNYGEGMKEVYDEVKASGLLEERNIRTLEQLKALELELGDKFPGIELEEDTLSTLDYYLKRIFEKVGENLKEVSGIKKDLDLFGYDLREHVLPGIKIKVGLIESSSLSEEIKQLKIQIDERAKEIDIKNTEYKAAVQEALKAAAGMNIVGLAMAIYMGVEAENIRDRRNELYELQEADIKTLTNKNQTLGSLARVKHDLQSLIIVAIDADVATQNLMHVWSVMQLCVNNSAQAVGRITDALTLRIFMREFAEVVEPWEQIKQDSDKLIEVFKAADEEYDRNYGKAVRSSRFVVRPENVYPPVDLSVLRQCRLQMSDDRTQAAVWKTKLNYMPDLFDRFNRVVLGVSQSASDLQNAALSSSNTLSESLRRLGKFEEELTNETDEQVIEEIKTECRALLDETWKEVGTQGSGVSGALKEISANFDLRLTAGYIVDFERDVQEAAAEVNELKSQRVAVQAERAPVIAAIETLEKSGIEELGKSVALTVDKIVALGLTPPQVALVMFAIEQLKKSIGSIGDGIRFMDMVRESDKLKVKLTALDQQIDLQETKVSTSAGCIKYLQAIHAIEQQRQTYVEGYRPASDAYTQYLSETDKRAFADDEVRNSAFKTHAKQFLDFLTPLSVPNN